MPHTVHAGRGTTMISRPVAQLLTGLGVTRSHSRQETSNGNPCSEDRFKTVKYSGDFPERFGSLQHARGWCDGLLTCYNHEYRQSAIGLHTQASVHFGTADLVRRQWAITLAQAYVARPERFGRRPQPPALPTAVWIKEPRPKTEPEKQNSWPQTPSAYRSGGWPGRTGFLIG
ncbi:hypothetical protein ACIRQP_42270 [Streptomyces sp. NPDC102274]|uniref:hypothetical protein n=1 Tax=Streptomyces sp. NPDC102274 TaxID=3366151 RepID=UPI0037F9550D